MVEFLFGPNHTPRDGLDYRLGLPVSTMAVAMDLRSVIEDELDQDKAEKYGKKPFGGDVRKQAAAKDAVLALTRDFTLLSPVAEALTKAFEAKALETAQSLDQAGRGRFD